ncbi:MAG: hypothetical protein PHS93_07600 [Candidatus Omnitrophica bacterium]|nr:hypothetical protein [Candidatus Omnitrophota bacterium]
MPAYGVNNIEMYASLGSIVVYDVKNDYRLGTFKMGSGNSNPDFSLAMTGYAGGYKIARGTQVATASEAVTTGLTSIVAFATGIESKRATTANYCVLTTGKVSSGTLTIYNWQHKTATASTLVAATSAATINWIAVGT